MVWEISIPQIGRCIKTIIFNYDRGWDKKPANRMHKKLLRVILQQLEKCSFSEIG
jgi:hypothetical protein